MKNFNSTLSKKMPFTWLPASLVVLAALTSVFTGCAKKKDATASPAEAAPAPPAPPPTPAPPANPAPPAAPTVPPVSVASPPGPQEDIPYQDLTWIQHIVDPGISVYQGVLRGPRPFPVISEDLEPMDRDDDSEWDDDGYWRRKDHNKTMHAHDSSYYSEDREYVEQDVTITLGKHAVPAQNGVLGPTQAIQNAVYLHFYSDGPLGKIAFSRYVNLTFGHEYILPGYGRQTRISLTSHRVEIPELADDRVSTFAVELQLALRQGNIVDPAQTGIRILGCVPSSCSKSRTPRGVRLKLRGGRR